jgi:hypothetical protein
MLKDKNQKPFVEGLYRNRIFGDISKIYYLKETHGMWIARNSSGEVYELDLPQGLPDSSLMPEGKIDASHLERMTVNHTLRVIRELSQRIKQDSEVLTFLAQYNVIDTSTE